MRETTDTRTHTTTFDKFIGSVENDNEKINKEILEYCVSFFRYENGYKLHDSIEILLTKDGDVYCLTRECYYVDWSKYALENEELTKIAKDFLDKYLVEDCKLISYETTPSNIVKTIDGRILVNFYINVTAEYKGEIISGRTFTTITFPDEITDIEFYG